MEPEEPLAFLRRIEGLTGALANLSLVLQAGGREQQEGGVAEDLQENRIVEGMRQLEVLGEIQDIINNRAVELAEIQGNHGNLQPGRIYHSTTVMDANGRLHGIGPAYLDENTYQDRNEQIYGMRNPPPHQCWNCRHRTDISEEQKYHRKIHCSRATGNRTLSTADVVSAIMDRRG
jgi:hypothetical protein